MRFRPAFALALLLAGPAGGEPATPRVLARYKEMLAANPAEGTALERLWKEYRETGRTDELLKEYAAAPGFAGRMVFGLLLQKAGRLAEAKAALAAAAALERTSPLPLLALARLSEGQPREAAARLEEALALLPEGDRRRPGALQDLGAAWLAAGEAERAAEAWEKIVALDPGNPELRRHLAEEYLRHRLPERARPHLEYLTSHAPPAERAQAWRLLGQLHQRAGEIDEAIAALEQGRALTAPGNWLRTELEGQLVRLCQREGRVPELVARWQAYARDNPRDAGGPLQLADLFHRLGEQEAEREALERLTVLLPKNTEYRARLARLLARSDETAAAAAYDTLLTAQPENADWTFERAELEVRAGHPEAAEARVAALLQARKDDEGARVRVLDFYREHRMNAPLEALLAGAAAAGSEEAGLAYANFLLAQHREEAAIAQWRRLRQPGSAASALRVSGWLRQRNLLAPAAEEARQAVAWAAEDPPRRREALQALSETESALGHAAAALAAAEEAGRLSATLAEQTETDRRVFALLREQEAPLAAKEETLTRAASTAEGWLRVARWQSWHGRGAAADAGIEKALSLNPRSLAAHELAVELASARPGAPGAAAHLQRLAELEPAQAAAYRRREAALAAEGGHPADAAETLEALALEQPGNLDVLTDLATAQTAAGQWEAALETWRKRSALTPSARQKECLAPMLSLYDRLHRSRAAAELLLEQTGRAPGEKEAREWFEQLLARCRKEGLLPWLREAWERRRAEKAEDFFTELAWSEILKSTGERELAFRTLQSAIYLAPEPAEALPELIREAENLRRYPEAIALQQKLLRLAPREQPEPYQRLAGLQEKAYAISAAAETWTAVRRRFPRDGEALRQAAEFFQRQGETATAAEVLRQCVALQGPSAPVLARLADCALESGDRAGAEAALEEVLQVVPAPAGETAIRFPELPSASPERDARLRAIQALGTLVREKGDSATLARWAARWQAVSGTNPTEALRALFAAGAGAPALELGERFCGREAGQWPNHESLILMGLELREFGRLAQWVSSGERPSETRALFRRLLAKYLAEHGSEPEPSLLQSLAQPGRQGWAWELASTCGSAGGFRAALALSEGARSPARLRERAGWQLGLGENGAALRSLKEAAAAEGESYDAPALTAYREAWLLLPPEERGRLPEGTAEVSQALRALLRCALAADEPGVRREAARLLRLRVVLTTAEDETGDDRNRITAAARAWNFLLVTGVRLEEWNLRSAAVELWQQALADPALLRLQGKEAQEIAADLRTRLYSIRLFLAAPGELEDGLAEYAREAPPLEGVTAVAEALESSGALPRALEVYRQLWERDPGSPQLLRDLLNLARRMGDSETLESVLESCIADRLMAANPNVQRDLELQLLDSLASRHASGEAVLARALAEAPNDVRLLTRQAQTLRGEEAEQAWRRILSLAPGNATARQELASVLEQRGEYAPALALLESGPPEAAQPMLARLLLRAGRPGDAIRAAEQAAPAQQEGAATELSRLLREAGELQTARAVLAGAVARAVEPLAALRLQESLLETYYGGKEPAEIGREWRRLRRLCGGDPGRLGIYYSWSAIHAGELGVAGAAEEERRAAWAGGRGLVQAGMAVLGTELDAHAPGTARTLETLLSRREMTAPLLQALLSPLRTGGRPDLAARVQQKLLTAFPASGNLREECEDLRRAGRPEEAAREISRLAARTPLSPELAARAAQEWLALGEPRRAEPLFAAATARENMLPSAAPYLAFAKLLREAGRAPEAAPLLERAARYPGPAAAREIAAWLRSTGTGEAGLTRFTLTPRQSEAVRAELQAGAP